jgi:hypothetical protein
VSGEEGVFCAVFRWGAVPEWEDRGEFWTEVEQKKGFEE